MTVNSNGSLVSVEEHDGGIHVLRLTNGKLNPLSVELLTELHAAVRGLQGSARAIVITGNDRAFAAGADITQFTAGTDPFAIASPERVTEIGQSFLRTLNAVAGLDCPTIAAVSGVALGGGCELSLACDFRIAASRALFGQPEILLGIIPGGGGTQRLARLVGPARAKDLVFSGRTVDADEAYRIGLIDRIVDADQDVVDAAVEWAAAFANGPAAALSLAKAAIDGGLEGSLDEGLRLEADLFVRSFGTLDAAVGVESFLANGPGKARFDEDAR